MQLNCKMCGGQIHAEPNQFYGTCDSCGGTMTLPRASDERKANLFNRANHFRRANDFDKAATAYENILNEDATDAEAHWGAVLSRYGIEYVEDPATHQPVPTCHRVQRDSILGDADYLAALEQAPDGYTKSLYEAEAAQIAAIQKGILAISANEQPYDVFICYKETTEGGARTKDSALAQDIYYQLKKEGIRTFFARVSLEDKLGKEYEPYIFAALNSARVMLVIGTKAEYFNAPWVKNEWSRYLGIMKKDRSRTLIPCYSDMDAYDLPEALSMLQSQDMGKIGFLQDIIRGVEKLTHAAAPAANASATSQEAAPGVQSLYKRALLFLEDGKFKEAEEYFEKVLDIDPEFAPAYMGKVCVAFELRHEADIANEDEAIFAEPNYQKAVRFAKANEKSCYQKYADAILFKKRAEEERIAEDTAQLVALQNQLNEKWRQANEEARELNAEIEQLNKKRHERAAENAERTKKLKDEIAALTLQRTGLGLFKGKEKAAIDAQLALLETELETALKTALSQVPSEAHTAEKRLLELKCRVLQRHSGDAISVATSHVVGLKADGTVVATKPSDDYDNGQCNVGGWRDIVAVSAATYITVGLKGDGTVVSTNNNSAIGEWRNIIAVFAGSCGIYGLKADGTVLFTGSKLFKAKLDSWCDVVAITEEIMGYGKTAYPIGLRKDGKLLAARYVSDYDDFTKWHDIVAIASSESSCVIIGLKSDGSVVSRSSNKQYKHMPIEWQGIVAISDYQGSAGLKADGSVIVRAYDESDSFSEYVMPYTAGWHNIVAISGGGRWPFGIKSDGTVIGNSAARFPDLSGCPEYSEIENWTDMMIYRY